jgi:hypothetical protein
LLREPNLRRVSGDLEMDDSLSMVIKYHHGTNVAVATTNMSTATMTVIWFQKAAPSWGGSLRAPRQIPSNGGLTDLDAELEQFAVDTRCAPKRVVEAHLTDQIAYFVARLGPSRTA